MSEENSNGPPKKEPTMGGDEGAEKAPHLTPVPPTAPLTEEELEDKRKKASKFKEQLAKNRETGNTGTNPILEKENKVEHKSSKILAYTVGIVGGLGIMVMLGFSFLNGSEKDFKSEPLNKGKEVVAPAVSNMKAVEEKVEKIFSEIAGLKKDGERYQAAIVALDKQVEAVKARPTQSVHQQVTAACEPSKPAPVAKKKVVAPKVVPQPQVQRPAPQQQQHVAPVLPPSYGPPAVVPQAPAVASGMLLLWHAHDATAGSPKPCVISGGEGAGLPPYCSKFSVVPLIGNETKNDWLVRVGRQFGATNRPTDTGMFTQR